MKWLYWSAGIILTLCILLFVILFTPPGNTLLTPVIEKKMQAALKIPAKLEHFRLSTDHFEAVVVLSKGNRIESTGNFALFSQSLSARYRAELNDLAALRPLIKQPLQGGLLTQGTVSGTVQALTIEGESDLAGSTTTYASEVVEFNPESVTLKMHRADIAELLLMVMQPKFAKGKLDIDANISLASKTPEGELHINVANGSIDTAVMKNEYNVTLPKSAIALHADGTFDAKRADYVLALNSNLAQINSKGSVVPKPLSADVAYSFKIKELGLFKPITHAPLRGPIMLKGTLKGNEEQMHLLAHSDLAGSSTKITSTLTDYRPDTLKLDINHLKLKKLLYTLGQPLYADADVTLTADLSKLMDTHRKGNVSLDMRQGVADRAVIAKAFDWPLFKGTRFNLGLNTRLDGNRADSTFDFTSDLLAFHATPARYTISKKRLETDYTATLPDLGALYFLTNHPLRGSAKITGNLAFENNLTLSADSDILGGSIRSTLKDGRIHADLQGIQTLQALYMITYPEVFDARLNGNLDYLLASKTGTLKATLSDGRFTKNNAFDLLRNYSNINLYDERFKGETASRINDKKIDADMMLHSNRSSITTKHAIIDSAAKTIDANVHLDANNNPVDFRLKGALDHPDIAVDAGKLIEREAGKQIKHLLNNLFK